MDLDELQSPEPIQPLRKPSHLNMQVVLPKATSADGVTTQVVAVSLMSFHVNNLSCLAHTETQVRLQAVRRPLKWQSESQPNSGESHMKRISVTYTINHANLHINGHFVNPVSLSTCTQRPSGTPGTLNFE